jgi:tripeptidyl-peptidase I
MRVLHGTIQELLPYQSYGKVGRPAASQKHQIVIAVKQNNLHDLVHDQLTNPTHDRFEKWLSFEETRKLTSIDESYFEVKRWLKHHGLDHIESKSRNYITVTSTIRRLEELLENEFHFWGDTLQELNTTTATIHSDKYHLDETVFQHVEHLFGCVDPKPMLHNMDTAFTITNLMNTTDADNHTNVTNSHGNSLTGGSTITPAFLSKLYRKNGSLLGHPTHKQSVFSTANEWFSPSDLKIFQRKHGLLETTIESIGNHDLTGENCSTPDEPNSNGCWEGNLDVQYLQGTAPGVATRYHYVGSSNPFLEYILAVSNEENPALVHSISWGSTEQAVSKAVMKAFCNEAMVLASRGVSIIVSSGDNGGVGTGFSSTGACSKTTCETDSSSRTGSASNWGGKSWTGSGFFPSFPATCPYVTSVGATMGPEFGYSETTCQSDVGFSSTTSRGGVITSGGGFSTYFSRPDWQDFAVKTYMKTASSLPSSGFNAEGRGFPDISAIGVRYGVVVGGQTFHLYGTSASAPVIAGFITLVNGLRAAENRTSIGWINKTLYKAAESSSSNSNSNISASIYNDVTEGNTKCCSNSYISKAICCSQGFVASEGWDPVSGHGSVDFQKFASVFETVAPEYPHNQLLEKYGLSEFQLYLILAVGSIVLCCGLSCLFTCIKRWRQGTPRLDPIGRGEAEPARINALYQDQNQVRYDIAVISTAPPVVEQCPYCRAVFVNPVDLVEHVDAAHSYPDEGEINAVHATYTNTTQV